MAKAGFTTIWEFHIRKEHVPQFEQVYGADGSWAKLFRKSQEYRGTQLLCDEAKENRYITVDRWSSQQAYELFRREHEAEYEALDKVCSDWTESETEVGRFIEIEAR